MHLVSQNSADTQAIAAKLAQELVAKMPGKSVATIVALRGDLGAGKTTFAQGFAAGLGVTEKAKSPTFTLAKQYAIPNSHVPGVMQRYYLWHLDCYRLNDRNDLAALDLHAVFADNHNVVLIEWPERIGDGLPREHVEVHMAHVGAEKRSIVVTHP